MAGSQYYIAVATDEFDAALIAIRSAHEHGDAADRARIDVGLAAFDGSDPAWLINYVDGLGNFHAVPGPRLLDLVLPVAAIDLPIGGPRSRFARIAAHLSAIVREVIRR